MSEKLRIIDILYWEKQKFFGYKWVHFNPDEVSKNFRVPYKVHLNARQDRKSKPHGKSGNGGFDRFAKKELLNVMNAKVMQEKGFVDHIAKLVGREDELGKGENVCFFNMFKLILIGMI